MNTTSPLSMLRHHVSGAIERGEKTAIAGQPAAGEAAHTPALRYNGVIPMHSPRALEVGQIAEILTDNGEYWADVYAPDFKTAQQRAAFIVRACNSHAAYAKLHDMLSDMIEGGRLNPSLIPDDYAALVSQLCECAALQSAKE